MDTTLTCEQSAWADRCPAVRRLLPFPVTARWIRHGSGTPGSVRPWTLSTISS